MGLGQVDADADADDNNNNNNKLLIVTETKKSTKYVYCRRTCNKQTNNVLLNCWNCDDNDDGEHRTKCLLNQYEFNKI